MEGERESRAGQVLASKYRLEELLGSGGMGHVYRAINELVGRPVAIKLLRPEHAANADIVERFLREARAANLVRHPNVVDVLDIGTDGDGSPFIVQELLTGEDLARYVERRGPLSLEQVVDLLCPVIDAVAEAHQRGVVHRDIKPENVFLARDVGGRIVPKLLDFGISKVRATGEARATAVGVMMGTPAYMPPEQLQGARDADARSDVWALGVMLFEVLSGRLPFVADEAPALFVAIATKDAPRLQDIGVDVPPHVSKIVERCLRRKPAERYPSAAELARDLRLMVQGQELEPTGKRSIPPELLALAPSISVPPSPIAPTIAGVGDGAGGGVRSIPDLPDLDVPPKKLAPAARAPEPPAPQRSRGPVEQSLPGVMLGGSTSPATPRRPVSADFGIRAPAPAPADMSRVSALSIVATLALASVVVLTAVAHRPGGWSFMGLVAPEQGSLVVAGQSVAALIAAILGGQHVRRAVKTWLGEATGSRASAAATALFAGALFFAAIELFRGGL